MPGDTPRLILGASILLVTLVLIMVRPYRISEAAAALVGAIAMLLGQFISLPDAWDVLRHEWNVYGFFLGLMAISSLADRAGIFDVLADGAARFGRGEGVRLYLAVFAVGVLITTFLSNDATALILTPVVYTLVTRLRLPVLPFMFACTFIADTASFVLPVSNPINILVLDAFGADLPTFLRFLLLPSLAAITVNIALFTWLFRRDLHVTYDLADLPPVTLADPRFFRYTVATLGLIALAYIAALSLQFPISAIALGGSLLLIIGAAYYRTLDWRKLGRDISWALFIFISGLFIIVRGVENLGLTQIFGNALVNLAGDSPLAATLFTTLGAALGSNMINNVPMTVVMISALEAVRDTAPHHQLMVFATLFGADLGPNLTTVGSLATMLWLLILRRQGLEVSGLAYFKLGILVVPPMLLLGALLIWLQR